MGGHSVWTSLPATIDPKKNNILTLSTLDSISLFHGKAIGAVSEMSSLIANLVALDALTSPENEIQYKDFKKQLIFMFFEGESFGNVGSSRLLQNIINFDCELWKDNNTCSTPNYPNTDFRKINLTKTDAVIELKQVGTRLGQAEDRNLYVHNNEHNFENPIADTLISIADNIDGLSLLKASEETDGLPPSSSLTFVKNESLALTDKTFVITDHAAEYNNKYYHSHFDDFENIDIDAVKKSAKFLAQSLYSLANEIDAVDASMVSINETLVEDLTYCLTKNISCSLVSTILQDTRLSKTPTPSHYPGPFFTNSISITSKFVHDFAYLSLNRTRTPGCDKCEDKCISGYCISAYVHYHEAYSIGLKRNYQDGSYSIIDKKEPNWVESYWTPIGIRLYYAGSSSKEAIFLIFSIILMAFFAGLCVLFQNKFSKHFKTL